MCGRYSLLASDPAKLRARFRISEQFDLRPSFNIAPGSRVLAITNDQRERPHAELLRWGLVPEWARSARTSFHMINARAETLSERPAYRPLFKRFRCLILADGFYEWQHRDGRATKQPFHITRSDGEVFAMAGLWTSWHPGQTDELRSCTIITAAANAAVATIHDRMPVILCASDETTWLNNATSAPALTAMLSGLPARLLVTRPVGPAVNDVRHDGPECLMDPSPPSQASLAPL
ncbi:MAG: SOS response-associated peptidase [Solirubrobacteraceae bacterium]